MRDLISSLRSGKVLVMDGAMGTELCRLMKSPRVESSEEYNRCNPAMVRSIHQAYRDAGADVLLTNTFQANPAALGRRGRAGELHDVWREAIRLARLDGPRAPYVLADIGPLETIDQPLVSQLLDECVD